MATTPNPADLYAAITGAAQRMARLGVPPIHETLYASFGETMKGDKPIPKRKQRYHANAAKRAEARWNGAEKMLALLAPAGVQSGPRAMDMLTRKYGI